MTGCTVSRRALLGGGAALVVGCALPRAAPAAEVRAGSLKSLQAAPGVEAWVQVGSDGRVTVLTGKAELGQGIRTALLQVAAEELGLDPDALTLVTADTARTPDEGYTAGSHSMQDSATALRQAAATARALLLAEAGTRLGLDPGTLRLDQGAAIAPDGRRLPVADLAAGAALNGPVSREAALTPPDRYRVVGRALPRVDIPAKVAGGPAYLHDLRPEGLVHARILRPPRPGARLVRLDAEAVARRPGVLAVHRDGGFVAVLAEQEYAAVTAQRALARAAVWEGGETLPADLFADLAALPAQRTVIHSAGPEAPPPGRSYRARFRRPYQMHASIGPSCALALFAEGRLTVWSHAQGMFPLRTAIAEMLGLPEEAVRCIHAEGSGCYGHNGADDVALDAALLARAVPGLPVQVVWSRQDEMAWSPLAPAMVVDIEVGVDAEGLPCRWRQEIRGNGHSSRPWSPGHPPLLAAMHVADAAVPVPAGDPPMATGGGSGRNAVPGYRVGPVEVVAHRLQEMPLRTSAMRALGAHLNVFAIEQVIDELAGDAGCDPVAYRLALLDDPRATRVIEAAAATAGWGNPLPAGTTGRGIGWARYKETGAYCAVVAEVEADTEVRVTRLTVAADVGAVVNPAGATAQLEGAAVQATSWTVKEQVRFDRNAITSLTWDDYPILTFSEVPAVEVVLVGDPGDPSLGAGEAAVGPTAAAIGNALAAALGLRVRSLPLVAANILAAIG